MGETRYTDEQVVAGLTHVLTTDRLRALIVQASGMVEGVGLVVESDPDIKPEMRTVLASLQEAVEAMRRAHQFSQARAEVQLGDVL